MLQPDGTVTVRPEFRAIQDSWYQGLASMARSGTSLILDDVLLTGSAGPWRLRAARDGLSVLQVGVHCDPLVAAGREAGRPDRIPGMAPAQATAVHAGVVYGLEAGTAGWSALECARRIARSVAR